LSVIDRDHFFGMGLRIAILVPDVVKKNGDFFFGFILAKSLACRSVTRLSLGTPLVDYYR
jgi:hypothetical protein